VLTALLPGRHLLILVTALVVVTAATSCASGGSDRLPGPAQQVTVSGRGLTVTREPNHVCVHGPWSSLPTCLTVDAESSDAVLSAELDPLDTAAELLVVVTRPDISLGDLPPGAVRTVIGRGPAREASLAVWLALPPAGTPRVCATVTGSSAYDRFGVYRTIENPPGGVAEVAVDEC
jgi:hypothetical protein